VGIERTIEWIDLFIALVGIGNPTLLGVGLKSFSNPWMLCLIECYVCGFRSTYGRSC
jgi:hypothetical protein